MRSRPQRPTPAPSPSRQQAQRHTTEEQPTIRLLHWATDAFVCRGVLGTSRSSIHKCTDELEWRYQVPMRPAPFCKVFHKHVGNCLAFWVEHCCFDPYSDAFDERPYFVAPPTESRGFAFQENRHGRVPTCRSENQHRSGIEPASFQHRSGIEQASIQPRSSIIPASFQHRSGIVPASLQHRLRPCLAAVCNAWAVAHSRAVASRQ